MLELKTRKIDSILELKIDGFVYSVDLADQTPFQELVQLASELTELGQPTGDIESTKEYINSCTRIRNKEAALLTKLLGDEKAAERLIGEGVNLFRMVEAITLISEIYTSEEAQKVFESLAGDKLLTLDAKNFKQSGKNELDLEKFEELMHKYEEKKAE